MPCNQNLQIVFHGYILYQITWLCQSNAWYQVKLYRRLLLQISRNRNTYIKCYNESCTFQNKHVFSKANVMLIPFYQTFNWTLYNTNDMQYWYCSRVFKIVNRLEVGSFQISTNQEETAIATEKATASNPRQTHL